MKYILLLVLASCARVDSPSYCPLNQSLSPSNGKSTVLIIGDSISVGYTITIRTQLTNYDVVHNPCNAMETTWTRSQINKWLDSRAQFEAITWNNGMWDIADWVQTTDYDYVSNLHYIAKKIKAKTSRPLFILTTQVLPGTPHRVDANVFHKNQLAAQVMAQEGIPVLDLYSVSQGIPLYHVDPHDVHYTPAGYQILGNAVLSALDSIYGIN